MSALADVLNRFPELPLEPFEVAGKLDYADTAPVLTIRPHKLAVPEPPAAPTPAIPRSQACRRKYLTQVTYPRVVCYPLPDSVVVAALTANKSEGYRLRENETDVEAIARHERFTPGSVRLARQPELSRQTSS